VIWDDGKTNSCLVHTFDILGLHRKESCAQSSGNLLLVKHGPLDERTRRERLTAYASDDDGKTWHGGLMLDEREKVTYPDGVQAPDGTIYIIYDYNRTPDGGVLMATFGEKDIRADGGARTRLAYEWKSAGCTTSHEVAGRKTVTRRVSEGTPQIPRLRVGLV